MTERILLVGMMGAGKTTTGRLVAGKLGWDYLDSDAEVEKETGLTVPELFARDGEAAFRDAEADGAPRGVRQHRSGGGLGGRRRRAAAREPGPPARQRPGGLAAGPARDPGRAGWATAPGARSSRATPAAALLALEPSAARSTPRWRTTTIDVDDLSPDEVAARIIDRSARAAPGRPAPVMREIEVALGARSYPVLDRRREPATSWPASCRRRPSGPSWSPRKRWRRPGGWTASTPACPSRSAPSPEGEANKTLATVEGLCRRFAQDGLSRADVVVAVGGGIVTDVAGFAAASYHRGTAYVNIATTLLGQVDAAIGGKTGVNLPEGKNLVGAFWQPGAVLCDTETLDHAAAPGVGLRQGGDGQVRLLGRAAPAPTPTWTSRWRAAWRSRPRWWPPTSGRATGGWSSTTGTRWPTPSRGSA